MSATKFTPGPWHWTLNVTMHETRIEAPSGTVIAQKWRRTGAARGSAIRWLTPAPDSIAVADAKLIAAAPDLHEALLALRTREAPDCWCPSAHKHGRAIAADEHTNECTMTSAALAKAEGKP